MGDSKLALHGGRPVRQDRLPYGRQSINEDDVRAVAEVLRSNWLTTGPEVVEFETAFADVTGAAHAVAVSSGTAALHAAVYALGIGPGDEVVVPAMTFAATANAVVYQGGTPVFADVEPDTLLIDPEDVARKITARTRAVIVVDYAGQPCHYDALSGLTQKHGLALVADACHAIGGAYKGRPVGSLADLSTFSLHPVKHVTAGEGGVVTTDQPELAERMRAFRNHGITTDHRQRAEKGRFFYEMVSLGFNYRLTDFQCALGRSQLRRLAEFVAARRALAAAYDARLAQMAGLRPLTVREHVTHAYHLYVVQLAFDHLVARRDQIFTALQAEGIGVNVHYIPVHLHPFYRRRFATAIGQCPVAEAAYDRILSLPVFPSMTTEDLESVIAALTKVLQHFAS